MLYDFLLGAVIGGVFESTRSRRYDRGDVVEAVVVDKALETFRASDSADAIRDIGRESSSDLSRDLSDPAPHDIMRSELIPTHLQTRSRNSMQRLLEDIQVNGIQEPVKYVVFHGEKYVVDGHHRLLAAGKLGIQTIPAVEVKLPYLGYQSSDDLFWNN